MKKLLPILFIFCTNYAFADNDVTNSNNSQTATNYIDDHRTEQTYNNQVDNRIDSSVDNSVLNDTSTHQDNSIDNTIHTGSDNIKGSYNQANQQTINNINTEGDLTGSKNTNSYNTDSHNVDTSESGNNLSSNSGGNTLQSRQNQIQRQAQTTGATTVHTGSVNINNNQVRQHRVVPLAFSPSMGMSVSQDNCSNGASLGVSTGIFGVSGGVPISSDDCNRRKDVAMWMSLQQDSIACQRMIQSEENALAMKKAGLTCEMLVEAARPTYVLTPSTLNVPSNTYWLKQERLVDARLNEIFKNKLQK